MKIQERYGLLNYAKNEYYRIFKSDYQFKKLSKRALLKLLEDNKHSAMCEWWYCCEGLYHNCWQEPIEEGCWSATQKEVDNTIRETITSTAKICRKDNRILYHEDEHGVHVIIVARDVLECDYLIFSQMKKGFDIKNRLL